MGVPTSEVGYTPAMRRREDHEIHKGHVVALGGKKKNLYGWSYPFPNCLGHNEEVASIPSIGGVDMNVWPATYPQTQIRF